MKSAIKLKLDPFFMPMYKVLESITKRAHSNQFVHVSLVHPNYVTYDRIEVPIDQELTEEDIRFIERYIKTLIWSKGGHELYIDGPEKITHFVQDAYQYKGCRDFDVKFMEKVFDQPFKVHVVNHTLFPKPYFNHMKKGYDVKGCRIGFDAGGSDRKVSAIQDGKVLYSEEVLWYPKLNSNPQYHLDEIIKAFKTAQSYLPRVDAIGISSAGVYVNNETKVASLFIQVDANDYEKVRHIYRDAVSAIGDIPFEVANDGDVTALAGAMSLGCNNLLGIAMGTSEAVGYVNRHGAITGFLNELAFAPLDFNDEGAVDEWSGDYGCGVKYLSQDAIIRLAKTAGIDIDPSLSLAKQLECVQKLVEERNEQAIEVFKTVGVYLGYAILYYHHFYQMDYVMLLGRVTSGYGGVIMIEHAMSIIEIENEKLAHVIQIMLPDESSRRVGQSVAAASLVELKE